MNHSKCAFHTIAAEMARQGFTAKALAKELSLSPSGLSLKLMRKSPFTLKEAFQIQALFPSQSLTNLFAEEYCEIQLEKLRKQRIGEASNAIF